jgi:hypothetical protein
MEETDYKTFFRYWGKNEPIEIYRVRYVPLLLQVEKSSPLQGEVGGVF